jgi:hypothetical protein
MVDNMEIEEIKKKLLSPEALESIDSLDREISSRPNYIGPEAWLKLSEKYMKDFLQSACTKEREGN